MLFKQSPRGHFKKFSCPPVEVGARCSGAAFIDLDNDGDLDLYTTSNTPIKATKTGTRRDAELERGRLYRNDGKGKFADVTADSGLTPPTLVRARDIGVFDYNADGLLDLLVLQDKGIMPEDKPTGPHLFSKSRRPEVQECGNGGWVAG